MGIIRVSPWGAELLSSMFFFANDDEHKLIIIIIIIIIYHDFLPTPRRGSHVK